MLKSSTVNSISYCIPSQRMGMVSRKNALGMRQQQLWFCCMSVAGENWCVSCRFLITTAGAQVSLLSITLRPCRKSYFFNRSIQTLLNLCYLYLSSPALNAPLILTVILACQWDPKLKHKMMKAIFVLTSKELWHPRTENVNFFRLSRSLRMFIYWSSNQSSECGIAAGLVVHIDQWVKSTYGETVIVQLQVHSGGVLFERY